MCQLACSDMTFDPDHYVSRASATQIRLVFQFCDNDN